MNLERERAERAVIAFEKKMGTLSPEGTNAMLLEALVHGVLAVADELRDLRLEMLEGRD